MVRLLLVMAAAWALPLALPAQARADTGADKVIVGAYIKDIQDIDLQSESFTLDFYLWFRWKNPAINPASTVETMTSNGFQNTTTSSTGGVVGKPLYDAPVDLPDGYKYQVLRFQGVFSRKLLLQEYPFDTQTLRVALKDERSDVRKLNYVVDKKPISMNKSLLISIPGFSLGDPTLFILDHAYETDFGDTSAPADVPYSCIVIEIRATRNMLPYLVKIVLPIFIVILITSLIYVLPARLEEARAGIGVTAMLTMVALQWTADSSLPSVEYLTMLDLLYLLSMLYILAAMAYTVVASRRNRHEVAQALTAATDRRAGLASLLIYGALLAVTTYMYLHGDHSLSKFL
ncbi:MAG: hypothetical protein ACOYEV_19010 [Candidatus Nanopelagicales bacterium]